MTGNLGVRRNFLEGGNEKLGPILHAKRTREQWHPQAATEFADVQGIAYIALKCTSSRASSTFMTKPKAKEPSFEEALEKLESIVSKMEDGDVPLAELLTQFEEGSKLLKQCESRLKEAEIRIEQLKVNKSGEESFEAFQTTESDD